MAEEVPDEELREEEEKKEKEKEVKVALHIFEPVFSISLPKVAPGTSACSVQVTISKGAPETNTIASCTYAATGAETST